MKSSPRRAIDVFDFDEDDGVSESLAGKYSSKLRCRTPEDNAPSICDSPECDVDADKNKVVSMNECCEERPSSHDERSEFKLDNEESTKFVYEAEKRCLELKASALAKFQLSCDRLDSSSEDEAIDVTSDADESLARSSSSSPASVMAEDNGGLNGHELDHCSGDTEMDEMNMTVELRPDYITYRDNYYTEPRVVFSESCIKIMRSDAYKNQEAFHFKWGCDDVVNIVSQMFQRVETVMIKLRVLSKGTDNDVHQLGSIDEVKIFAVEPNWHIKQEEITSLNHKYFSVWVDSDDTDKAVGTDGEDTPRKAPYFPVFEESFEDVIYPKGEADAVSISKRDVDLLQPETFINDTIVDFYIKYLKNQIQPEERQKIHFFNSFFFRKLADLDKDPLNAADGAAAFQRVRKWTRKVDLFGKEFVFVPINFSLHWSLIVICHPGEAATFADENLDKSLKVPCILHMDSIKGNHAGLKHLIQSYLWEEWKERKKETSEEVLSRFHNLRFVSLELPQQENSFDCGLFLLHYLERFLADVPDNFNPYKIEKSSSFLSGNWFPPAEASLKRALIQRLISELLKNHSQEVSSPASSDDDQIMDCNGNGVGENFLSARFDPGPSCQPNKPSSSEVNHGIELTLLSASSMRNSQCVDNSGLVLRDLFNPGDSLMEQCQTFDQKSSCYRLNGAISPLEDPETGEQFIFGENEFHRIQMKGITSQSGCGNETFGAGITLQTEHGGIDCTGEPSIGATDDSSDIAITQPFSVTEPSSPSQKERSDEPRSPSVRHMEDLVSTSRESPDTPAAAEASQNRDMVQSGNENGSWAISFVEYQDAPVSQEAVMADKGMDLSDDVHIIEDDGMVVSNTPGEQLLDIRIGLGDNAQNFKDGLAGLVSLGLQPVEKESGLGDYALMIPDSHREQPVGLETDLGNNLQSFAKDGSVGLKSPEQKPTDDVAVDTSHIFEDVPAAPDSPIIDLGGSDSLTVEDALVGPDSPEQRHKNVDVEGSGDDDSQVFEDAQADLDPPGEQLEDNGIGVDHNIQISDNRAGSSEDAQMKKVELGVSENKAGLGNNAQIKEDGSHSQPMDDTSIVLADNSQIIENNDSVAQQLREQSEDNPVVISHEPVDPNSPGQHPAKRPRLLPSVETQD